MTKGDYIKGIAVYKHQQNVLLRLIKQHKGLHQNEFDRIFRSCKSKHSLRLVGLTEDTFILGLGRFATSCWSEWLELLQIMVSIGLVAQEGKIPNMKYTIPNKDLNE